MRPHVPELQWTWVVFSAFLFIDLLIADRVVQRLILHSAPVSPDGPIFFVLLLGLQVLLVWLLARLRAIIAHYQRLKVTYEQELDLSRQVMEGADVGLGVLDEGGHFMYVNRAYAELLGRSSSELLGQPAMSVVQTKGGQSAGTIVERWRKHPPGKPLVMPVLLRRKDGSSVMAQVRVTPRVHGNRIVGNIVSVVATEDDQPEKTPQSR